MGSSSSSRVPDGFMLYPRGSGAGLGATGRNPKKNVTMLLSLQLVLVLCVVQVRSEAHDRPSTYLRAQLSSPWLSCRNNAGVCKDPNKNPYVGATTCCGKRICANLENDIQNCGTCGRFCPYGCACCSGKCVKLQTDKHNCGNCGHACRGSSVCSFGLCGYAAGSGHGFGRNGRI